MSTYQRYDGEPAADQSTPYAHRQRIAAQLREHLPATVDAHGDPAKSAPTPAAPAFDAIGTANPEVALSVLKAADALGVDRATVNTLMDSQAFVNAVTGAAPDEITAAITARTTTAPRMKPNPAQGRTGSAQPYQPQTFEDRLRGTLDNPDTGRDGGLVGRFI